VGAEVSLGIEVGVVLGVELVLELEMHEHAGWKEEQLSSMLRMCPTTDSNKGRWAGDLAIPRSKRTCCQIISYVDPSGRWLTKNLREST